MTTTTTATDLKLCGDCHNRVHGYDPDMGDDATTFAPGDCSDCGANGIVFVLVVD